MRSIAIKKIQKKMSILSNYYRWGLRFYGSFKDKIVWDAGSGNGKAAYILAKECKRVFITDKDDNTLAELTELFKGMNNVFVLKDDLESDTKERMKKQSIETIVLLDVLEHLKDDADVLKRLYDILSINGEILIKVPAHSFLFCEIDRASGHYRRYNKREFSKKTQDAGLKIEKINYMNVPGFLLYLFSGKILGAKRQFAGNFSDLFLRVLNSSIPVIAFFEKYIPCPFGLSIIAVLKKCG